MYSVLRDKKIKALTNLAFRRGRGEVNAKTSAYERTHNACTHTPYHTRRTDGGILFYKGGGESQKKRQRGFSLLVSQTFVTTLLVLQQTLVAFLQGFLPAGSEDSRFGRLTFTVYRNKT